MKKLFLLFATTLLFGLPAYTQVTLQSVLPVTGLVQKNQLWNLVVVNAAGNSMNCRVELTLRDRVTGQIVLTASTATFTIAKGSKQLNAGSLAPVQYNYLSARTSRDVNSLIPIGSYNACYLLINYRNDAQETVAEECIAFDVEPLSPPMLIFPKDSSILDVQPSQFSWIPPSPMKMFSALNYEVIITEIKEGQKAEEAIQENMPVYAASNLQTSTLSYSRASESLQKEKWYAWQVVARDENNYAAKTETWVFKLANEKPAEPMLRGIPFTKMKVSSPETAIAPNGYLKFSYNNQLTDSHLRVVITDLSGKATKEMHFDVDIISGENLITFPLKKILDYAEESTYMASLVNSKGEKWVMLFRVKEFTDN